MFLRVRVKLSILMIFAMLFCMVQFSYADTTAQKMKKVEAQRNQIQTKLNNLRKLERQENNKLTRNQQKLEKNQQALQTSKKQMAQKQSNIYSLQSKLDKSLAQYNSTQKNTAERIRFIYKTKHILILDLLLSTNNISQFLDRIYYQNLIIQSDKKKLSAYKQEARDIALLKRKLETEKNQLNVIIRNIDKENATIKKTINQNKTMIDKIQKDRRAFEKAERELSKQSASLAAMIAKTTRNSSVNVGNGFLMPVSGARITSPFGWRVHPIFKKKIFHSGIDYGVPYGTPIKASNAGQVIFSGWYGGYGKVVIIDHGSCTGQPTTTLYAHMSRQAVSVGQSVTRGQVIGYVGSTGYSTGPHVHFEVRINGKPQNPNNYL